MHFAGRLCLAEARLVDLSWDPIAVNWLVVALLDVTPPWCSGGSAAADTRNGFVGRQVQKPTDLVASGSALRRPDA